MKYKFFEDTTKEWLDFIAENRHGLNKNNYDVIEGPMSDDKLYDFVEAYLTNELSYTRFAELAKFKKETHQIVLKENALKCLRFIKYYEVDPYEYR